MRHLEGFGGSLPCEFFETVLQSRSTHVNELRKIKDRLEEVYSCYSTLISNFTQRIGKSQFIEQRENFISLYSHPPVQLSNYIRERRNNHDLDFCPYCGNPVRPDTLDHFIPKREWPEFSIFSNNLVPQCRACAPIKGEKYYSDSDSCAIFIHPFYFNFMGNVKFHIEVEFDSKKENIIINVVVKTKKLDQESQDRIALHANNLKVRSRIESYCHKEFNMWKRKRREKKFDIKNALMLRQSEIPKENIGKEWKSAFHSALLNSEETINYINSIEEKKKSKSEDIYEGEVII